MIFAFHEPMALVDTNFARVGERVFGYNMPSQPHKSEEVYQFFDALMPDNPGLCRALNLALLDLADAICTPSDPSCPSCPLQRLRVCTGKRIEGDQARSCYLTTRKPHSC